MEEIEVKEKDDDDEGDDGNYGMMISGFQVGLTGKVGEKYD